MIGDYPLDNRRVDGGVQAVFAYLVDAMRDVDRIDLHVITFKQIINRYQWVNEKGFYLHVIRKEPFGIPTLFYCDLRNVRRLLSSIKPDIVHAQGAGFEGFLALKSGHPSLITFHGILREDAKYVSKYSQMLRLRFGSMICEDHCARNASHAILISPYVAEYFGSRLKAEQYLIPNPVKRDFFDLPRVEEQGRILFAGRVIPRKGVMDLVKAVSRSRDQTELRLFLAGSLGDEKYVKKLRNYICRHNMEDYVKFAGLLDEKEILCEFSRCSLLLLPSYQETAPMVIQQAMAAGKPVIAARICGVPYQVEHGVTGLLFEPGDVESLSAHLVRLLEDGNLRRNMGENAREKALTSYHAKRVAEKTIEVYEDVITDYHS